MKLTLFACALMLLTLTACGQTGSAMTSAADVDIALQVEPEPLTVGETTLLVTLTDGSGSLIDGARLQIQGNMDHAGMMAVDRQINESINGVYRVPFEWTMGGGWSVTVTAQLPDGGEISETFDFFVDAVSSESIINRQDGLDSTAVNISYQPDNDPVIIGDAFVTITLTNADNAPIADADVDIVGNMEHADMMPISGKGEHNGGGRYTVQLHWTMAGDWQVTVKVTLADGRQFEKVFDQAVMIP
jgi:hypothetical protein